MYLFVIWDQEIMQNISKLIYYEISNHSIQISASESTKNSMRTSAFLLEDKAVIWIPNAYKYTKVCGIWIWDFDLVSVLAQRKVLTS